jgi:RNA polymerase sigma-70 factor (sigma-E family)
MEPVRTDAVPADADEALTALFHAHYTGLLRLAIALHGDDLMAEDAVQDAFARTYCRWAHLRDHDRALAYLRACVANSARSGFRRLRVARRHVPPHVPHGPSAEEAVLLRDEHAVVLRALRALPARQRQVLVLRYYGELSEAAIATALGVTAGSVKKHAARGIAALGRELGADR